LKERGRESRVRARFRSIRALDVGVPDRRKARPQSYKPWQINARELSAGMKDCQISTADPTTLGYGFRLYVGP
jgi:hypothetical protein